MVHAECELCQTEGEDLALFEANHKEKGTVYVCRDCWKELRSKNQTFISGSSDGGEGISSGCSTCGI